MHSVAATENVVKGTVVLNGAKMYRTVTVNTTNIKEKLLFVTDVTATGKRSYDKVTE